MLLKRRRTKGQALEPKWLQKPAIQQELRFHDLVVRLALTLVWLRLDDLIVQLTLSLAWLRHDQRCYESAEGQKDKHLSQNGYRNLLFLMSMAIADTSCYCFLPLPFAWKTIGKQVEPSIRTPSGLCQDSTG